MVLLRILVLKVIASDGSAVVHSAALLNHHGSNPRWGNQSLYDFSIGNSVLAALTHITISLLLKRFMIEGAIVSLARRWLLLIKVLTQVQPSVSASPRVTQEFLSFELK